MKRPKRFGLLILMLFVVIAGCETTDYEPLLMKKKLQEMEAEIDVLKDEITKLKSRSVVSIESDDSAMLQTEKNQSNNSTEDSNSASSSVAVSSVAAENTSKETTESKNKLTAAEEQPIREELENADAYFDTNEAGFTTEVDLAECRSGNEFLKKIIDFSEVSNVSLDGTRCDSDTFELLGQFPNLQSLSIPRSAPTEDDLEHLKGLKKLKFLQLQLATLSNAAVKKISEFPALEQIRCAKTRVSDADLVHLANLKTLKAIDLSDNTGVSIKGITELAKCPKLSFLKVYGPAINDEVLKVVGTMKSLTVLGLNDTAVTDVGLKELKGLDLKEIHLLRTLISDESLKLISEMPNVVSLNLRDTRLTDEGIEYLTKLDKLQKLNLSECNSPGITDASGPILARMKNLTQLNLWSTKFSDKGLASVVELTKLTSLNLDNTNMTNEGIKLLEKMPQLTWLHLGDAMITDEVGGVLKGLKNLTYLDLKRTKLSQDMKYEIDDELSPNGCDIRF